MFSNADFAFRKVTDRQRNKENESKPVKGKDLNTPSPYIVFSCTDTFCDSVLAELQTTLKMRPLPGQNRGP